MIREVGEPIVARSKANPESSEPTPPCEICLGYGVVPWPNPDRIAPCSVCPEGMRRMGVPARYASAHLKHDYPAPVLQRFDGWHGAAPGWYLHGPVGVGKTHLAAALCRRVARHGGRARFVHGAEYLEDLRDSYDGDGDHNGELIVRQIAGADMVVLDDLGGERLTDWGREQLLLVINRLYNRNAGLIVTSNLDRETLAEHLGQRAASRVIGLTEPLYLDGRDLRRQPSPLG